MFSPLTKMAMNMKRFLISLSLLAAFPLIGAAQSMADSTATDTVHLAVEQTDLHELHHQDSITIARLNERIANYEKRLARRNKIWLSLLPSFYRLQYAGSIGLINAGAGWHYGKRHQWETDFMFGYVPRYCKDDAFATFTLRQTYVPWTKPLYTFKSEKGKGAYFSWQPLSCGLFLNSVLQSDYWTKEPERYPDRDYYRFSSKIRFHLFVGQRYTFHIPKEHRYLIKNISAVWELSSCDLYIVSKFVNGTLPLKDILSLSLGLKFGI